MDATMWYIFNVLKCKTKKYENRKAKRQKSKSDK